MMSRHAAKLGIPPAFRAERSGGNAAWSAHSCEYGQAETHSPRRGPKRTRLPAIIRAATELFAQWGFEQPTLDQIAQAAGVRKATLYTYFDGKSALIEAVLDHWLRELPVVQPVSRDLPLRQQLFDIGHQLRKLAAHPAVVSLTRSFSEAEQRLSPQQVGTWRRRYAEFETHLAGMLERNCNCEYPSQVDRQFLLLAIGGLLW